MLPAFAKVSQFFKTVGRVARWRIVGQTYELQPIELLTAGNSTESIEQAEYHSVENCFFFSTSEIRPRIHVSEMFRSPEISVAEIDDVEVIGWTDFLTKRGVAYLPNDAEPENDVFVAELENRAVYNRKSAKLKLLPSTKVLKSLRAISLLGQSSTNYAHWISEVLPKLLIVKDRINTLDYDILIDFHLHQNQLSSLASLGVQWKSIKFVQPWQRVKVRKLLYVTPAAYTPADNRLRFEAGKFPLPLNRSMFSPQLLDRVREEFTKSAAKFDNASRIRRVIRQQEIKLRLHHRETFPTTGNRKIIRHNSLDGVNSPQFSRALYRRFNPKRILFLRSPGSHNGRHCENLSAIIPLLEDFGFCRIIVDALTFDEQVSLMKDAECVVSLMGASLANLAFAPAKTKVVILSPFYDNGDYSYFRHFMAALGHKTAFVLGYQIPQMGRTQLTSNYKIEVSLVRDALIHLLGNEDLAL